MELDRNFIFLYGVAVGSSLPKPLPLMKQAVAFAFKCHRHQVRDDEKPYISHPIAACNTLIILGVYDDSYLAATILHDVVEKGQATLKEITRKFGKKVAHLVDIQTKRENEKPEEYYARIGSEIGGILGKGADRLHNITNMIDVYEFFRLKRYVEETDQYVLPMLRNARYEYLEYANALVLLYESIKNIVILARKYIEAKEAAERV